MKNCIQGYLTIYTALTMAVLISLCLTLIEGIRQNTLRMEIECVMDIAMTSVLAEYHRELLNQYGFFFVDSSYGTGAPSYQNMEKSLEHYLSRNMAVDEVFLSNFFYKDFLAMEVEWVSIDRISIATDEDGAVVRRQAIETIKGDIGLGLLEEIAGWMEVVEDYSLDNNALQQQKDATDRKIQEYQGIEKMISETEWTVIDIVNPTEHIEKKRSAGVLKWVVEDMEKLSQKAVDEEEFISARRKQGIINSGNIMYGEEEGLTDKILFQEYLLSYSGFYGKELEKGALTYQLEYMIAGKNNDLENLKSVVERICLMREVANFAYLLSDQKKCAEAEAAAAILAGIIMLPEITPLLKTSILLGWAYLESLHDLEVLLDGGKIPLLKDVSSWHYDIDSVFEEEMKQDSKGNETGLDYADYLRILLTLTGLDTLTFRFLDVVEMDIRETPGNRGFRIDGCIDCYVATIKVKSAYGYEYFITRQKQYW